MRQVPQDAAAPLTRLAELPGRGVTRVWECAGPPGAQTLLLIHGVTFTAELNWAKVLAPLARHFRVIALDLRGHGDGISAAGRFLLEDCADDIAVLAQALLQACWSVAPDRLVTDGARTHGQAPRHPVLGPGDGAAEAVLP